MRLLAILVPAVVCLAAQTPTPQQDPARPQFKTGIEVRQLDVVVLDRDGRPVRGLTAGDFTIVEAGQPQKIVTLEEIVVPEPEPPSAAWIREVAPDVKTNDVPLDGRLMVIVMDDALTRDLQLIEPARRIGREIVNRMGPADLAAVVFTLQNSKSQDFTSDRARLLAAVERFTPGFAPGSSLEESMYRQYSVRTLAKASESLRAIEGRRKSLIYVSVGVPVDWDEISTPVANLGVEGVTVGGKEAMRDLGEDLQSTLNESQLSNVAVYAISPRGLTVEDRRLETDFLQTVSANTGGFAIVNTNAPEARVQSIFTATSAYYLIGYEVERQDDGRYRRLEVKVNRPDVTVHTRKGYFARRAAKRASNAKPEAEVSALATAMAGFLPKGDIPMQVTALPFALPGKPAAGVAIAARVQQAPVTKRTVQQVELLTTAFDPDGRPVGSKRQMARVVLLPSDTDTAQYDVLSRIDLKPGRYSLRIAAHNKTIDKSGSVFYDVDVPDFRKDGVWLSGAAITVKPGLAAAPRDALVALLPVIPTTLREFVEDDAVSGFVQVSQGGSKPIVPVHLEIRIRDGSGATIHGATDTLEAPMFSAVRSAEYVFAIPIDQLRPGPHLLTIDASAAGRTAHRDVRFTRR
ncbi:MAG TPA: VWA domain-containing protein [Vicinamibacterales bacterium]|nr:VWA domain-containing protein [Vicinamibacterales bacterium]